MQEGGGLELRREGRVWEIERKPRLVGTEQVRIDGHRHEQGQVMRDLVR